MKLFLSLAFLTLLLASCSLGSSQTSTHTEGDGHADHSASTKPASTDDAMVTHCQSMPEMAGCSKYLSGAASDTHTEGSHDMSKMVMGDPSEYKVTFLNTWETSDIKPLQFRIERAWESVKNYDIAHEKKLHFIAVRSDLSDFQHIHPTLDETSGVWSVDMKLPSEGKYRLFADFIESGKSNVVVPTDISTPQGDKALTTTLTVSTKKIVELGGGYRAEMVFPKEIHAGSPVSYTVRLTKDFKNVSELENYLGAKGHSVIIRENTLDFVHAHPASAETNSATFMTTLTQTGTYAVFTQVQHDGKVLTIPYVIAVTGEHKDGDTH